MDKYPLGRKIRSYHRTTLDQDTSHVMPQEKDFPFIARSSAKAVKLYPRPTNSRNKTLGKSHFKRLPGTEVSLSVKVNTVDRVTGHDKYFAKLQPGKIIPLGKKKIMTMSSATTSLYQDAYSRRRAPQTVSLSWSDIRPKNRKHLLSNLIVNCAPSFHLGTNLCNCEAPCKWASRWTTWSKGANSDIYEGLKELSVDSQTDIQIRKDLKRTQPNNPSFKQRHNLRRLQQVLQSYCKYDKQLSYIQGMNMIASAILFHVKDPGETFWVMVDIMERREFREVYLNSFSLLMVHIKVVNQLIELKINDLCEMFRTLGVKIDVVLVGWFLSLMLQLIPLESSHLMVDLFIRRGFQGLYRIILCYLIFLKQQLYFRQDASDILYRLSSTFPQSQLPWEEIFEAAESFPLSSQQLSNVRSSV